MTQERKADHGIYAVTRDLDSHEERHGEYQRTWGSTGRSVRALQPPPTPAAGTIDPAPCSRSEGTCCCGPVCLTRAAHFLIGKRLLRKRSMKTPVNWYKLNRLRERRLLRLVLAEGCFHSRVSHHLRVAHLQITTPSITSAGRNSLPPARSRSMSVNCSIFLVLHVLSRDLF
jgi:hypothetical protein